ncbi:MAG: hypothetical protein WC831_01355 [Parcubacteria group bacterium]|jgi:DNA-binding NtrC family response regulator
MSELAGKATRSVLIVGGNEQLRGVLADMAKEEGFEANTFATGEEAVVFIHESPENQPLAVVCFFDLGRGRMKGNQILRELIRVYPETPAVLVSVESSLGKFVEEEGFQFLSELDFHGIQGFIRGLRM